MTATGATAEDRAALPFQVGERLVYQIYWGPFAVGRASLEVGGIDNVMGHECYHLIARARTSGIAELLYSVDSTTESWFDTKQLFTRRYRENRVEGNHRRERDIWYDYENGFLSISNLINRTSQQVPLAQPVQDVISTLYFMRTQQLALDKKNQFVVNSSDKNYDVTLKPDLRKSLSLRGLGKIHALRIEPVPTLKIVSSNKGRMWLWVSDDDRRLPLVLASTMRIGSAKLILSKVDQIDPIARFRLADSEKLNKAIGPVAASHRADQSQE